MQLSVKALMSESLGIVLDNVGEIFKSIGWFLLFVIGGGLVALVCIVISIYPAIKKLQAEGYGGETGDFVAALQDGVLTFGDILGALIGYFLLFVAIVFAMSQIFNKWVRIGAFGPAGRHFKTSSDSFKAACLNALKFFFIGVFLLVINILVSFVMNKLGLGPTFMEQITATEEEAFSMAIASAPSQIATLILSSAAYAYFSANLTGTALGSDKEGLETPQIKEFALALIGLYLVLYIPTFLVTLTGSMGLLLIVQLLIGVVVSFAASVAHGVRYRMCRPEHEGVAYAVTGHEANSQGVQADQDQNSSNGPWG